jgi:hypothetical protein
MTTPRPTPNLDAAVAVKPPFWLQLAGTHKPFILHPNGQRQPATDDQIDHYMATGELPERSPNP